MIIGHGVNAAGRPSKRPRRGCILRTGRTKVVYLSAHTPRRVPVSRRIAVNPTETGEVHTFNRRSYDFKRKVKQCTRTERPTRYYIIDFGLSRAFSAGEELVAPVSFASGGDRPVPEYKDPSRAVSNPFAIDIYCLGNFIREWFMDVRLLVSCTQSVLTCNRRRVAAWNS